MLDYDRDNVPVRGQRFLAFLFAGTIGILLILALWWHLIYLPAERKKLAGELSQCRKNLEEIGNAIEMYAYGHSWQYPRSIAQLTPGYLKAIPSCPSAGFDTYSGTYQVFNDPHDYRDSCFTIYCKGHHHELLNMPEDFPRYTSKP